jgi:glucose-6-phosphate 1-dehydrogenase
MGAIPTEGHIYVVFGATGDLVGRKLLPGLYQVSRTFSSHAHFFHVLGLGRGSRTDAEYQSQEAARLRTFGGVPSSAARAWSRKHLSYCSLGEGGPEEFLKLKARVEELETQYHLPGNRVLYLALPAEAFPRTVQRLGEARLNRAPGWTRIVVEKPFGRDLRSAERLNELIHRYFDERQVFRIDHYLGKETVQNLLAFRFANMLFESVWNRDRVDHVEITVAEEIGVEHRASYYDHSGALRDMVQSHLTQLLTLTAMEVPASLDADQVRNEKVKVLRALNPIRPEDVVFGQYQSGEIRGNRVPGYREEEGVRRTSRTETFVALRLWVNSWRWHGIPFILRTGKRLPAKSTRIVVRFRSPPVWFFPNGQQAGITANALTITIQPDEGFELGFEIKKPGQGIELETHRLHFRYSEAFGPLADAYQTLLTDILEGDQTLFVRGDEVEAAWRVFEPVLRHPPTVHGYPAGSWGPVQADRLLTDRDEAWLND